MVCVFDYLFFFCHFVKRLCFVDRMRQLYSCPFRCQATLLDNLQVKKTFLCKLFDISLSDL